MAAASSHTYPYEWWESAEGYWTYAIRWYKEGRHWHSYKRW